MLTRIINVLMSIITLISSLFGAGAGKEENILKYNFLRTTVTVSVKENPSTGYKWNYNIINETVAEVTADKYTNTAPADVVGAAGVREITFTGIRQGTTKVILSYEREWENSPIRVITLMLTVNADKTIEAYVYSDTGSF